MNREIRELTDIMTQMDLTDIYRISHPNRKEYTFFSAPHGTFSKTDHILGNKANLKTIGITPCILLAQQGLKLEFNSNTNLKKPTNNMEIKQCSPESSMVQGRN